MCVACTKTTNITFRDVLQNTKNKRAVLQYLVTQMWKNRKSNLQNVWCRKYYSIFTNKTGDVPQNNRWLRDAYEIKKRVTIPQKWPRQKWCVSAVVPYFLIYHCCFLLFTDVNTVQYLLFSGIFLLYIIFS